MLSTEVEISLLVAALVKATQPEFIVEVGSHYGQTAFLSAYAPIYSSTNANVGVLGIDINASKVVEKERVFIRNGLIILIAIIPVIYLLGAFIGRLFASPLTQLANEARKAGEGDYRMQEIPNPGTSEVADLSSAFHVMTGRIAELVNSLEDKVAERTSQLEQATKRSEYRENLLLAVAEVSSAIASISDLVSLLPRIAEVISDRFGHYHVGIFLLDEKKEFATLKAARSVMVDDPRRQGYYTFAINPAAPNEVWVGTWGKGIYKSYDGQDFNIGAHGSDRAMFGKHVNALLFHPDHGLVAATEEGVFRTADGGDTWEEFSAGLGTPQVRTLGLTEKGKLLCGTAGYEMYASASPPRWEQLPGLDNFPSGPSGTTGPSTNTRSCSSILPIRTSSTWARSRPGATRAWTAVRPGASRTWAGSTSACSRLSPLPATPTSSTPARTTEPGSAGLVVGSTELPLLFDPSWDVAHRFGTEKLPETHVVVGGDVVETFVGATDWSDPAVRARIQKWAASPNSPSP